MYMWECYYIHNILYVCMHLLVLFGCLYALLMNVDLFTEKTLLCDGILGGRYSSWHAVSEAAIAGVTGTVACGRNYSGSQIFASVWHCTQVSSFRFFKCNFLIDMTVNRSSYLLYSFERNTCEIYVVNFR
jgi:hypothetical protein